MDREAFVRRYGSVYEHSPWVAEEAYATANGLGRKELATLFARIVDNAPRERQLALIRAHPDLAGKAAVAGELTAASSAEQASAGIDQCTRGEFEQFQALNARYRTKFGFPFVMAVRDSNREQILAAFAARLDNDPDTEFAASLDEIHKIARLRLEAL